LADEMVEVSGQLATEHHVIGDPLRSSMP
jgi:hypothetical protein